MALVDFRKINSETQKNSSRKTDQKLKLNFRELAVSRECKDVAVAAMAEDNRPVPKNRTLLYEKASLYLNQALSAVKNRRSFPLEPGFKILQKMAAVDHPEDELFIMAIHLDDRFQYVVHHSVNLAIYCLKMAQDLGFSKSDQLELAMAALLHDIGMAVIPDNILYKQEALSDHELEILRDRPNNSYKILRSFGDQFAYLAETAVQVYERIDGSGYPRGLKGGEIQECAQIVGLLDMFEALIHSRPQRDKLTHFTAVKEIINTCKTRFQRRHLKSLLRIFTAFPIHSYVRLNSDAIGKVIQTYPDQPMRPKLQILYDSQQRKVLTERIVVLPEDPLLNIVDSVSENEIEELSISAG